MLDFAARTQYSTSVFASPSSLNLHNHSSPNETLNNSAIRLSDDGVHYNPVKREAKFQISPNLKIKAAEVLIFENASSTNPAQKIKMQESGAGTLSVTVPNLAAGTHYAYRLFGENNQIHSPHCIDPYSLAVTQFNWLKPKGGFIERIQQAQKILAGDGPIKAFPDDYGLFLKLIGTPDSNDYQLPKSIVIDQSQLHRPEGLSDQQPLELGQMRICKFHPRQTANLDDSLISEDFRQYKGKLEILLDPKVRRLIKTTFGSNTIEFFPLNPNLPTAELFAQGRSPVWGYMPFHTGLNSEDFKSDDAHLNLSKFQYIVEVLKNDGFNVIADMVLFHTAENRLATPNFSLRALDEDAYYLKNPDGTDSNVSGCGNTLNVFNQKAQKLILSQADFYQKMFGCILRFDQAAIAHMDPNDHNQFQRTNEFTDKLYKDRFYIAEEGTARCLFMGQTGDLFRPNSKGAFKDFRMRNTCDLQDLGFERFDLYSQRNAAVYDGHREVKYQTLLSTQAFAGAGNIGFRGCHSQYDNIPQTRNKAVAVNSHDGHTPYDRAARFALRLFSKTSNHPIADKVREILSNNHNPAQRKFELDKLFKIATQIPDIASDITELRIARARMIKAYGFTLPGAILNVFGDAFLRTQNGNGDAYDQLELLENAASLKFSDYPNFAMAQINTGKLVEKLGAFRDRFDYIFANINGVDGHTRSTVNNNISTEYLCCNKFGTAINTQAAWDFGRDPKVRAFIGRTYTSKLHTESGAIDNSQIYICESGLPRTIQLPKLENNYTWKALIDSGQEEGTPLELEKNRESLIYRLDMPAIVIFERILKS